MNHHAGLIGVAFYAAKTPDIKRPGVDNGAAGVLGWPGMK
jgi:hypothetical protein